MTNEPDLHDPCSICRSPVRIRQKELRSLGGSEYMQIRICTNPDCKTNERHRSLGTPTP